MLSFDLGQIAKLRKENNLTIQEFANKIGTSKQAVSAWETGSAMPQVSTLIKICNCFGVPLSFFISSVHQNKQQKAA